MKPPNVRLRRRFENMQTYRRRGNWRKTVNLLVPDRVSFRRRSPILSIPRFNPIVLDMLSIVEPLHGQAMIEGHRLGENSFENSVVRTSWPGPEPARNATQRAFPGLAPALLQ